MSESSKKASSVGKGYTGREAQNVQFNYMTGLLGADSTSMHITHKQNFVNVVERKETPDAWRRRKGGYNSGR